MFFVKTLEYKKKQAYFYGKTYFSHDITRKSILKLKMFFIQTNLNSSLLNDL